ncbi:MAG: hypothetical protein ACI959_000406 [Limisphaerales bacterium]|jgi:hypothetical protein
MQTSIKSIAVILLSGLMFAGCENDFLDKAPLVGTTEANFYQTEEDAIAAVIYAYSVLQWDGHLNPAGHFSWFFGDIMSDDSEKGGSGDNDVFTLKQLEEFEANATNELVESEWKSNYAGIARANIVLEKVPEIEMNEITKTRLLAEAKFLRGWFYYSLVTQWGDVPLITESLAPSDYNQPRSSAIEVWALIETDLTEAAAILPLRSAMPLTETGRATQGMAQGLLAKAHAWQKEWAECKAACELIIGSGEYFMEPDYSTMFSMAGENGTGSIFEIQFMNQGTGDWGRFTEGTLTNVFQRARGQFGGYGFNLPTQSLSDEYESGDPRKGYTLFVEGDQMGDRGVFTKAATGFPHDYYSRKYFINSSEEAPIGDANVNGPSNERVIRYADILLFHAEASYHLGDEGGARDDINQVRARARAGVPGVLPNRTSSGEQLLEHIYHERRIELALEGHRMGDLNRTDRAGEVMRAQGKNFVDGTHELLPVPASEIAATNGVITQNPGY